jgi:hypothetical protein
MRGIEGEAKSVRLLDLPLLVEKITKVVDAWALTDVVSIHNFIL